MRLPSPSRGSHRRPRSRRARPDRPSALGPALQSRPDNGRSRSRRYVAVPGDDDPSLGQLGDFDERFMLLGGLRKASSSGCIVNSASSRGATGPSTIELAPFDRYGRGGRFCDAPWLASCPLDSHMVIRRLLRHRSRFAAVSSKNMRSRYENAMCLPCNTLCYNNYGRCVNLYD